MKDTQASEIPKVKSKREQRAIERDEKIRAQYEKLESMNITNIAEQELADDFGKAGMGSKFEHDDDEDGSDPSGLIKCLQAILSVF